MTMDIALLDPSRQVDTPTVRDAIEAAESKRGFASFTRAALPARHPAPPMVEAPPQSPRAPVDRPAEVIGPRPSPWSPTSISQTALSPAGARSTHACPRVSAGRER